MRTAYRSTDFNDERKWKSAHEHDDILQVGIKKAVGYSCFNNHESAEEFLKLNIGPDKLSYIKSHKDCISLWVGDAPMMEQLINIHKYIISQNYWPLDAEEFFKKLSLISVAHDDHPDFYHVICDFFNSWCLWCEDKIWTDNEVLSVDPFDPDNNNE